MSVKIMPKRAPRPKPPGNRLVVALAYDGLCTFEFGVAVEIFGLERPEMGDNWYSFRVAAADAVPMRAMGGIRVSVDGGLSLLERAGTIIVPGWRGADQPVPPSLVRALRRAHAKGARLLSFCSGVFVLAATGLLDGKRATTHWRYSDRLAKAYPHIGVVADVLYVDEGSLLTAAGIDLSLHLIRRDWGTAAANSVARRLVVPPHRDGGQAQFIDAPVPAAREGGRLGQVLDRLRAEPARDASIAALAREAGMSRRTFLRRFEAGTGRAAEAGFGTSANLRHHFRKELKVSPSDFRRRFGSPAA
jgi:AraC family transcriptional regulator, transcriptional activator FtrA